MACHASMKPVIPKCSLDHLVGAQERRESSAAQCPLGGPGGDPCRRHIRAEAHPRDGRGGHVPRLSPGAGAPGWLGPALISSFGWQGFFILGGVLPLILLIAIFVLPELTAISSIAATGRTRSRRCSSPRLASANSTARSNSRCQRTSTFPDSRSSICSPKAAPSIPCCCGSPSSATCSSSIISQAGCRWCCATWACPARRWRSPRRHRPLGRHRQHPGARPGRRPARPDARRDRALRAGGGFRLCHRPLGREHRGVEAI